MAKKKKLTKAERKEARLRKGKQWLAASGKCCPYMSIKFAVRQIIRGKDTITVDILHADNEIHSLPDQVCKGIKTFVTTVCHKDGIITILMKTIRSVQ